MFYLCHSCGQCDKLEYYKASSSVKSDISYHKEKNCYTNDSQYLVAPISVLSLINLHIDDREFQAWLMQTTF